MRFHIPSLSPGGLLKTLLQLGIHQGSDYIITYASVELGREKSISFGGAFSTAKGLE